jgi:SpoVK/Ycf46/Vps4 family AAA+-type ATPase
VRARKTTPCVVVFEDLDTLIDKRNRSFFLNEMDGFATNTGILVLATTNYPEKLDSAILDRPSRFDRKYYFELPAAKERRAYIEMWNGSLEIDLRLSEKVIAQIVEQTDGFSYAYMKELFLSSMMEWINKAEAGKMDGVMLGRSAVLRSQMKTNNKKEKKKAKGKGAQ